MTSEPAKPRNSTPILGLIGGIASGKSFVAEEFARQQCAIIDADKIGHEVLCDPAVQQQLIEVFGRPIVGKDDAIDRRKLATLVFGDDLQAIDNRRQLESIVHPEIRRRVQQRISDLSTPTLPRPAPPAIILDAPLLIEAGWDTLCDYVLFIDADYETRKFRAAQRGWNEQQWKAREASQVSIDSKRRAATHIISGEQSLEELRLRIRELLAELKAVA